MKTLIFISFLCISINAFSKSVSLEITSRIRINNIQEEQISKMRVEFNKEFLLPTKSSKILIRVEELQGISRGPGGERPILLSAEIYHLKNGETELVSKPHIVTYLGKRATFSTIDYDGREVTLSVKPLENK